MDEKGFTLIELIVVMAIIAILVLLAAPRFLGYTKDANVTAMQQDTKVLSDAVEMYHLNKGEWSIVDKDNPVSFGVGGSGELYKIDESKLSDSIKNIKGDYDEYGIAIDGEHTGQVFHLSGVKGKDNFTIYGNSLTDKQPIVFDSKRYEDISQVPEDPVELYTYRLKDNGYEITGFNQDYINKRLDGIQPTSISFPSRMRTSLGIEKPVIGIAGTNKIDDSVFKNINELVLSENIEIIGKRAFYRNNNNIKEVVIPHSTKEIKERAFEGAKVKKVILGNRVEKILENAFWGNSISEIKFPKTIKHIGLAAFIKNDLKIVDLPKNQYIYIAGGAFNDNQLEDGNAYFYSRNKDDGSINHDELISYGGKKREVVTVPKNVKIISNHAFYNNQIHNIIIPKSVTEIDFRAFDFNLLTEVYIPNSVKHLNESAFTRNGYSNTSDKIQVSDFHGSWSIVENKWVKGSTR